MNLFKCWLFIPVFNCNPHGQTVQEALADLGGLQAAYFGLKNRPHWHIFAGETALETSEVLTARVAMKVGI